jgi:PKD repeat protein
MSRKERDNNLEELFRRKLEENEMVAGSDLTHRFMRRLARREFIRFNPARFNIYYLAAALAGLTIAGLLLFRSPLHDRTDDAADQQQHSQAEPGLTSSSLAIIEKDHLPKSESSTVTHNKTASGARKAETAPGGATERQTAIITPLSENSKIRVKQPESEVITVAGRIPGAQIEASSYSGCVPLHVHFRSTADKYMNVHWSFGDGGTSTEIDPDYVYDLPGTYKISLVITDGKGRASMTSILIEAFGVPEAAFEIRQDEMNNEGSLTQFINLSAGAVRYQWNFGDGTTSASSEPSHTYRNSGRYDVTLVAWSENGCSDSLTINDVFTDKGMFIRFPNAFIPNKGGPTGGYYNLRTDQDNQVFHPVASGVTSYNLKIYSKAGLLVFESDELEMGWDGYYKGQKCNPGVYVWKVRGTYRNSQPIVMAGDVTLIDY